MEKKGQKKALFSVIIQEYLKTAKPVSSKLLVEKYKLGVSPATVRNKMMELEKEGYLTHPHTSAGRIPTEKGYKYYLENFFKEKDLEKKEKRILNRIKEKNIKKISKTLADLSQIAILVGLEENNFYYTGLANLFQQPEFSNLDLIYNISKLVDHLDEVMNKIYNEISEEIDIWLGQDNPFSEDCSIIITRYNPEGILGMLGPMRMDYESNYARIKYIQELLK